jgi:hypothetical protein
MLRHGAVFFALLLVGSAYCQNPSQSFKADPNYQAPVTLQVKNEPISDVIKAINRQTKLQIESSTSLDDLKLTIFVTGTPVGLVMDKIASVLDCAWIKDQAIEILAMPQTKQVARLKFMDLEARAQRAGAENEAHSLANAASSAASYSDFADAYTKISFPGQGPQVGGPTHIPVARRPGPFPTLASPATYAVGLMMAQWSDSNWNDFWGGAVFYTSFTREDPTGTASARQAQQFPPLYVFVRYDAFGGHEFQIAQPPQGRMARRPSQPDDDFSGELGQNDFAKAVLAWPDVNEGDKDDAFNKPLQGGAGSSQEPGPITPQVTMADQLERLSQGSGLPIVADGFHAAEHDVVKGGTPMAWLKSLQTIDHCYARIEDGVLMVRHAGFWRLRQEEIPESLIRPLAARSDSLGLMDYAGLVAALTPVQQGTFLENRPPVLGFSLDPVQFCLPGLAFLGSLSNVPAPGTAVSYESLSGSQQTLFSNAILESGFLGGNWAGGGPGMDPRKYGFVLKAAPVTENGLVVSGATLFFGSSMQDGIGYNVPLAP